MRNFVSADWHLFHENMLKHCNRPFGNTNQLMKTLIRNVNKVCNPEDNLWIVGDFSMKGISNRNAHNDVIERIRCNMHLVIGNHDKMTPLDYIRMGFQSVHTWFPLDKFGLIHDPYDSFTRNFPDKIWICGHVHNFWLYQNNRINVGVDMWNFHPVTLDQVRETIDKNIQQTH